MNKKKISQLLAISATAMILAFSSFSAAMGTVHATEDTGSSDLAAITITDEGENKFSYATLELFELEEQGTGQRNRSVIGFEVPDVELSIINRLGITISYYTYPGWWNGIFHNNPVDNTQFFDIKATTVKRYNGTILPLSTEAAVIVGDGWELPSIGRIPTTFMTYQNSCVIAMNQGVNDPYVLGSADFYTRDWYVILPVAFTYHEVIISIDAYTIEGEHISDGTDDDGLPFEDTLLGKYIDVKPGAARAVYFTSDSTINAIVVNDLVVGSVTVTAGEYNFTTNVFGEKLFDETYTTVGMDEVTIDIPFNQHAIITFNDIEDSFPFVRIFYDSETAAKLSNVNGTDGTPGSSGDDPQPEKENWFYRLLKALGIEDAYKQIMAGIYITLGVGALIFLTWVLEKWLIPFAKLLFPKLRA